MDAASDRFGVPVLPIIFVVASLAVFVGMVLNWIQPPAIGVSEGPEAMMFPLGLIFACFFGTVIATVTYFTKTRGWLACLITVGVALLAGGFGMGCGYGCFSAVWAT